MSEPLFKDNWLPHFMPEVAVRAAKAGPHLHSAGVDVMVNKTRNGGAGVINRMDCRNGVGKKALIVAL